MGKKDAPSPDKRIGKAALMSAETGQEFLEFMRVQSGITNAWAEEDRGRHRDVFLPLQDAYIAEAQKGPDYASVAGDVRRAKADVTNAFDSAQQQEQRRMAAMGVNPASGRSMEANRRSEMAEGLATAGAANSTRLTSRARAEAESEMRKSNAINMGAGLGVNPATSMGLSNGAMASGFGGAMQGYGQMGSLLNTQYQNEMAQWQANQNASASMWGGIGSVAGLGISMLSSKDLKTEKSPARAPLAQLRSMPVEEWRYKDGVADTERHIGPYAEDFHAATGKGDGTRIPLQDFIGLTAGAVQELAEKVDQLSKTVTA